MTDPEVDPFDGFFPVLVLDEFTLPLDFLSGDRGADSLAAAGRAIRAMPVQEIRCGFIQEGVISVRFGVRMDIVYTTSKAAAWCTREQMYSRVTAT